MSAEPQTSCHKTCRALEWQLRRYGGWGTLVVAVMAVVSSAAAAEHETFRYDAHGRRDPFEPLVTPTGELRRPRSAGGAAGDLRLEGIMWDAAQPLAIVNAEVRRVGDEVEGCRIVAIQPTAVIVETEDGQRTELSVVVEETGANNTAKERDETP